MKITAKDILALNPCEQWAARIPGLVGRGMTPHQIATTKKVEPTWRYWVLTRLAARTEAGRKGLVMWAVGVATDVRSGDEDTLDAIDTALHTVASWASGVVWLDDDGNDISRSVLLAARAADAAAYYAAYYAADYATADDTRAAVAAYYAAYYAARAADAAASTAAAINQMTSKWLGELAALVESLG